MPNSASAKKSLRQSEDLRLRNRSVRSAIRTQIKKVRVALKEGDVAKSEEAFRLAVKKLDKAAANHIFHANKTARLKSRLAKAIKTAKGIA
ncbi:30S ribosomal protein S20 [Botrimarina hoheduenensis]|nr:30S ribosomal protein S20 [Botrimarina hoheduenensis]